jgi:hypothetical protein
MEVESLNEYLKDENYTVDEQIQRDINQLMISYQVDLDEIIDHIEAITFQVDSK